MFRSLSTSYSDFHHGLCTYTYTQLPTLNFDDPIIRLEKYYTLRITSFYSIHRRPNLIRNMLLAHRCTGCHHFGELLLDGLALIQGKSKFLDTLYMVRQLTPDRESLKIIAWEELLLSNDFTQQYERYLDCQAEEIGRLTGKSISQAKDVVSRGFLVYTFFARVVTPSKIT